MAEGLEPGSPTCARRSGSLFAGLGVAARAGAHKAPVNNTIVL